jgi:hypothetical protein
LNDIKNEGHDIKIGTLRRGGTCRSGKGEWKIWRWGNMVDVVHILIQNRKWNLLQLFQVGQEGGWGGHGEGDQNNVQCKVIQNYHNQSSPYSEYMLIKMTKSHLTTFIIF